MNRFTLNSYQFIFPIDCLTQRPIQRIVFQQVYQVLHRHHIVYCYQLNTLLVQQPPEQQPANPAHSIDRNSHKGNFGRKDQYLVRIFLKTTGLENRFYQPHPLLQDSIHCIMPVHAIFDIPNPATPCFYPPTPQNSLFLYLRDTISAQLDTSRDFIPQPRAVIVGPQTKPVYLLLHQEHLAIRIGFHPSGLYRLLGIPLHELVDKSFDATHFFGRPLSLLVDQLQHSNGFAEMVRLVELFLLDQLVHQKTLLPFDQAMQTLLQSGGNCSVNQIASLACLSNRQFERVCKERIGLSPKYFARLIRFSRAYRMYEEQPNATWTSIAHRVGYFDQMHLIRDFHEFAHQSARGIEKEINQAPFKMQRDLRL